MSLTKEEQGCQFKDLDLLAKLLAPRPTAPQSIIEVLDDQASLVVINDEEEELVNQTSALSLQRDELALRHGEFLEGKGFFTVSRFNVLITKV